MHSSPLKLLAPILFGLAAIAAHSPAGATVADDLCLPVDDPCVIPGTVDLTVDDGSILNFGSRAVELDGTLRAGEGTMTILAGSFAINATGILRARGTIGGNIIVTTSGDIVVGGTTTFGALQLKGTFEGGDLQLLSTGGSITGAGRINLTGGETGGRGELTAVSIDLTGPLDASGSSFDTGGTFIVTTTSGPVHLADVDVRGGDAGELLVTSAGAVTLGNVIARATGDAGSGPFLFTFFVHSGGPIVIEGQIDAVGGVDGDGGELELIAGSPGARQDITVSAPILLYSRGDFGTFGELELEGAVVELSDRIDVSAGASGAGSDGLAGDVTAHATESLTLTATGNIKVKAGIDGMGGTVTLSSDGSLSLLGPIEANAGDSGGLVQLTAAEALDISAPIDVEGNEIDAGALIVRAGGPLTVADDLRANSNASDGGDVSLEGCIVTIEPGVVVDAGGPFCAPNSVFDPACRILIAASGSMSLLGDFTAGTGGRIDLAYRDPARPPDVGAAIFDIVPTLIEDPTLVVCDSDEDTFDDDVDNCVVVANPLQLDAESDGTGDLCDNCTNVANGPLLPDDGGNVQLDVDGDGYGGVCDCDFNNDGACNIGDFNSFLLDFTSGLDSGVGTDMNGTAGTVSILDFNLFLGGFSAGQPGPSAVAP